MLFLEQEMFHLQLVPTGLCFELYLLQKAFRLPILTLLMCQLIFVVIKKVNSPEASHEQDNLQFVDSKILKNIQLI